MGIVSVILITPYILLTVKKTFVTNMNLTTFRSTRVRLLTRHPKQNVVAELWRAPKTPAYSVM